MSNIPSTDATVKSIYDLTTNLFNGLEEIMVQLYSGGQHTADDLFVKLSAIAGGILTTQERLAEELMLDKQMQAIMLNQIGTKRTGLNSATSEVEGRISAEREAQAGAKGIGALFK